MSHKKNTKFVSIYNSFSENEKNEFRKFISCSLYNKGRDYNKFLDSLDAQNLNSETERIDEIKKNKPANDRTLWNRLSELTILAEKFLVFKKVESDSFSFNSILLQEYGKRNLSSLFTHTIPAIERNLIDSPLSIKKAKDLTEFYRLTLSNLKSVNDLYTDTFFRIDKSMVPKILLELLEKLIETWKFKISNPSLRKNTFLEDIFETIRFEEILKILKTNSPEYYHIIAFNYYIYKFMTEPENPGHYEKVKIFFNELHKNVSIDHLSLMYVNMLNALINKRNKDLSDINEELFFIIKSKLKQGFTKELKSKVFLENYFRDYVFIACSLNEIKWAEKFVEKYSDLLPTQLRDQITGLCMGFICFKKGEYAMCYQILKNIKTRDPFIYIDKTKLIIISSYEQNDIENCHTILKSFNEYLRRPKVVQDQLVSYSKIFSRAVSLLLKLKETPVKKNLLELEFYLSGKNFESIKWVSEKIKEIKIK